MELQDILDQCLDRQLLIDEGALSQLVPIFIHNVSCLMGIADICEQRFLNGDLPQALQDDQYRQRIGQAFFSDAALNSPVRPIVSFVLRASVFLAQSSQPTSLLSMLNCDLLQYGVVAVARLLFIFRPCAESRLSVAEQGRRSLQNLFRGLIKEAFVARSLEPSDAAQFREKMVNILMKLSFCWILKALLLGELVQRLDSLDVDQLQPTGPQCKHHADLPLPLFQLTVLLAQSLLIEVVPNCAEEENMPGQVHLGHGHEESSDMSSRQQMMSKLSGAMASQMTASDKASLAQQCIHWIQLLISVSDRLCVNYHKLFLPVSQAVAKLDMILKHFSSQLPCSTLPKASQHEGISAMD